MKDNIIAIVSGEHWDSKFYIFDSSTFRIPWVSNITLNSFPDSDRTMIRVSGVNISLTKC